MRPVLRRLIGYEALLSGAVGLEDVARMNDALDAQDENEARARAAAER